MLKSHNSGATSKEEPDKKTNETYKNLLNDWSYHFQTTTDKIDPEVKFFIKMISRQFVMFEKKIISAIEKLIPSRDWPTGGMPGN